MSLHTEWIQYGPDRKYTGFVARPKRVSKALPAVMVIQEIWGVDEHIQDVTKRFAQAGYVAFAPDLYSVDGSRPTALQPERIKMVKGFLEVLPPTAWGNPAERDAALDKLPSEERAAISETFATLFGGLKVDNYVPHLLSAAEFLRNEFAATKGQGVASVGYCMGGALSALMACRDEQLKGAVIFYGNAPSDEDIQTIQCPVMGFYGGHDKRITDAVPAFANTMESAGKRFTPVIYDDAHHAFFNDTRASYNVDAARDAYVRTLAFFQEVLC